jgi:UDP-N-acetyl-2-amino-2-deoxyglucuronate dehydrogenase
MTSTSTSKSFALIGAAGYIAPRHMKAIKDTGNSLVTALDPNDSVGIIDSYFPSAEFFTEFERFDRHIDKLRRRQTPIDYISICSPNYLHDAHMRFALRSNANAICEKPLVLNPRHLDALADIESETGRRIFNVLQLRLHSTIQALHERVRSAPPDKVYDVDLTYVTSRGHWYHSSWKGNSEKSGGIASNIGVHFFDMLTWVFGKQTDCAVHVLKPDVAAGYLLFQRARVRWFLSINSEHLPPNTKQPSYRSILIEGEELNFSEGFGDLHTKCYTDVLAGGGSSLMDARPAIEAVYEIGRATPKGLVGEYHPMCRDIVDTQ